jgi:hypothetical protein
MQTLDNLKLRLEALPGLREGRQHEARYAAFLKKTLPAKTDLEDASLAAIFANVILPADGYGDARKTVRTSVSIASRLKDKLDAEPGAVGEPSIDKSFTRLFENADSALKTCKTTWAESLQSKIKDWETIADVVAKLVPSEGARLQRAIASLRGAKASLPTTEKVSEEVQGHLQNLKDALSNLGLETAFGKFLQAAASPLGADLNATEAEEVTAMIKKHKLEKVFRIRLVS